MKKYIGTKQIEAEPMTMGEADKKCLIAAGGKLTKEERSINGYHVKYDNDIESWLPKDEFEETYKCADTFLDRLMIEHKELMERFEKCAAFVDSEKFREVVKEDYPAILLSLQCEIMKRYGRILKQRIAIAEGETNVKTLPRMSFGIAIEALKFGCAIRRESWNGKGFIDYTSLCLIYNENTGRAESWIPSISDVFAEDWEIVKS